jgi:hypothetical protein
MEKAGVGPMNQTCVQHGPGTVPGHAQEFIVDVGGRPRHCPIPGRAQQTNGPGAPGHDPAVPTAPGRGPQETLAILVPHVGDQLRLRIPQTPQVTCKLHVLRAGDGTWVVKAPGQEVSSTHASQPDANKWARKRLRQAGGGELVLHDRAGLITTRERIGA